MNMNSCFNIRTMVVAGLLALVPVAADAAVLNVPSIEYPNLYDAVPAALEGDEIRVANDYTETLAHVTLSGKNISIISYSPDFSAPAPGAKWETLVAGDINDALLTIASGGLTIEGFSMLSASDGNVFFMNSDSSLTVRDCTFSGIVLSDTAAVKTGSGAENVSVTIENTNITSNGRGIWFNRISGNSNLMLGNCVIENNGSYPIEWRTVTGNHQLEVRDSFISVHNNKPIRLYNFNAIDGLLSSNEVVFDKCEFELTSTSYAPIVLSGVADAADPDSTTTLDVRNSTFDLRSGIDDRNTAAIDVLDEADRQSEITLEHSTIVLTGENQCGIRLREGQSTAYVRNCIIDGDGQGYAALRSWRGTIISSVNLLNTTLETNSSTGQTIFSGEELIDVSPEFTDRAAGNFQLEADSPALAVGEDIGVTEDILGNPRPSPAGTDPDLGAFEMGDIASVSDWAIY